MKTGDTPAWLLIVGPSIIATLALIGVAVTVFQRARADRRDQWWKRTQWAADLCMRADEDAKTTGFAALTALGADDVSESDSELLSAIINLGLPDLGAGEPEAGLDFYLG